MSCCCCVFRESSSLLIFCFITMTSSSCCCLMRLTSSSYCCLMRPNSSHIFCFKLAISSPFFYFRLIFFSLNALMFLFFASLNSSISSHLHCSYLFTSYTIYCIFSVSRSCTIYVSVNRLIYEFCWSTAYNLMSFVSYWACNLISFVSYCSYIFVSSSCCYKFSQNIFDPSSRLLEVLISSIPASNSFCVC